MLKKIYNETSETIKLKSVEQANALINALIFIAAIFAAYFCGTKYASFPQQQQNTDQVPVIVEASPRIPYEKDFIETIEFSYKGKVINVVDGDTIDVLINRGFGDFTQKRIRLSGINAPEMKDVPKGEEAKKALIGLILDKEVVIKTKKDQTDIYGRYLGTIYLGENKLNVNDQMIKIGHAKLY